MSNFVTPPLPPIALPDWSLFGMIDDVRAPLFRALDAGQPAALATLFRLEGGGPRPVGTQMVFSHGQAHGFLSGGCIEADVALHAAEVLANGRPQRLVYGPSGPWPDIRLLCGAEIEVLVELVLPGDVAAAQLQAMTLARTAAVWLSDGVKRRCEPATPKQVSDWQDSPFEVTRRFDPAARLVIVGSDPAALAMASLGVLSGFETWLNRPKGPSTAAPISGLHYLRGDPGQALGEIGLDQWTAVAIASHDMDIDHDALMAALPSKAGYVGLLGARRRLAERVTQLAAKGLSADHIARLHAPIGLDLGGKAPWEVAVSVIGQIIQQRHKAPD